MYQGKIKVKWSSISGEGKKSKYLFELLEPLITMCVSTWVSVYAYTFSPCMPYLVIKQIIVTTESHNVQWVMSSFFERWGLDNNIKRTRAKTVVVSPMHCSANWLEDKSNIHHFVPEIGFTAKHFSVPFLSRWKNAFPPWHRTANDAPWTKINTQLNH